MNTVKKLMKKFGFMKSRGGLKKQLLLAISLILLLVFFDVKPAHAQFGWIGNLIGDLAFTVVGKAVFFISYIVSFIAGIFIAIEAWLIGAILNINTNLVNSAPVKFGFPVSLSVVNLGFVLGIIVIAIATILRYEQYGMKKILMKLVAAAILVNFSLVIAGTILNFSDQLTLFFLNSINPAGSVGGATNGLTSSNNFASAIAGAFNPQRNFITKLNTLNAQDRESLASSFGGAIGKMLTPITSLVFVVFSLILIVITLFALLIMLIVRYVYIGILLVIMPFAWLLWVFPNFQSSWNKWWHNFLRWTFFAPIVVFFLWLGIQTSAEISKGAQGTYNFAIYTSDSNPFWKAISEILTNVFSPIIENFLQMAIVLGLMLGGLFAANSFGITFANTAMGAVKTVGKGVGGWAGRRSKQLGGATLDRFGIRRASERLQQNRFGTGGGRFRRTISAPVRYGAALLGRGVENVSVTTRENLVKDAEKRLAHLTPAQLSNNMTSFTAPERIAALKMLRESGDLERNPDLDRYVDEETFRRFGQSPSYRDMDRALLSDNAMRRAAIDGTQLNENVVRAIIEGFRSVDISKGKNWDEMFGILAPGTRYMGMDNAQKERLNISQIRAMAQHNEKLISPIISQLRGNNLRNFQRMHEIAIQGLPNEARLRTNLEQKIYYQTFASGAAPTPAPTPTPSAGATTGGAAGGGGTTP